MKVPDEINSFCFPGNFLNVFMFYYVFLCAFLMVFSSKFRNSAKLQKCPKVVIAIVRKIIMYQYFRLLFHIVFVKMSK